MMPASFENDAGDDAVAGRRRHAHRQKKLVGAGARILPCLSSGAYLRPL